MSFFNDDSSSGKRLDVSAAAMKAAAKSLEGFVPDNDPVRLPADILPRRGLVVVAGHAGSGKSTTLKKLIERELAARPSAKVIEVADITPAALNLVTRGHARASQVVSGEHVASMGEGVLRSLTRKPDMIVMSEMRDGDAVRAALQAAMSGHLVLATAHAGSASDLFRRVHATLEGDRQAMIDLVYTLRVVIHQNLVRKNDGFQVTRQFLWIDENVLATLRNAPVETWTEILDRRIFGGRKMTDFGHLSSFRKFAHDPSGNRHVVLERFFNPDRKRDRKQAARAAVKAALQVDRPAPLCVFTPAGSEPLPQGMTLLMGAEGSGKSEMTLGLASQAVQAGRRAFLLDDEDFIASVQDRAGREAALVGKDFWRDADLVLQPLPFLGSARVEHVIDLCVAAKPGDLLAINLDILGHDAQDSFTLLRALADRGHHVVVSTQEMRGHVSSADLDDLKTLVLMRQVNAGSWMDRILKMAGLETIPAPRTMQALRPGEGFLAHAGTLTPFRSDMMRPGTFGLPPAAEAAAARLDVALGKHPCATHTERLEMVARAFGFRSWHAAQGRRK